MRRVCFVFCCLAAGAFGGVIVFPSANTSTEGASNTALGFPNSASFGFQYLLAGSELSGMATGAQITALGYRLDGGLPSGPATQTDYSNYTIALSTSQVAIGSLTNVFSSNMGADAVTVRTGALSVPAG